MLPPARANFWSPATAASLLFVWFVVVIGAGVENNAQRVGAVLAATFSAVLGGVAGDRLQPRHREAVTYLRR
jgi:hypothetical protein